MYTGKVNMAQVRLIRPGQTITVEGYKERQEVFSATPEERTTKDKRKYRL